MRIHLAQRIEQACRGGTLRGFLLANAPKLRLKELAQRTAAQIALRAHRLHPGGNARPVFCLRICRGGKQLRCQRASRRHVGSVRLRGGGRGIALAKACRCRLACRKALARRPCACLLILSVHHIHQSFVLPAFSGILCARILRKRGIDCLVIIPGGSQGSRIRALQALRGAPRRGQGLRRNIVKNTRRVVIIHSLTCFIRIVIAALPALAAPYRARAPPGSAAHPSSAAHPP